MDLFLGGMFQNKENRNILKKIKKISILSNDINKKTKELEEEEFQFLLEHKEEVYISLSDFLDLIKIKELKLKDILIKCSHISSIKPDKYSSIELCAIPDKRGHIILCPDTKNCKEHSDYSGDKIRITTIKRQK